jgi:phospholipase/lecithinase/hemolysin
VKQYSGANVYDYAISGAVCDNVMALGQRKGIKQDQVPAFLGDNAWVNPTSGEPALDNPSNETVYAVWIGTNDLGNGVFLTERQPKGLSITSYMDCVFEQLDRLYEVGARNFIIMNLAPLDLLPQYALPENDGVDVSRFWQDKLEYNPNITQTSEKIRQYTDATNEIYKLQAPYQVVLQGRYSESTFAVFDVHTLVGAMSQLQTSEANAMQITRMWQEPSDYFNGTAPLNTTGFVTACKDSTCANKSDWDSFIWYDELHPSEQADRIIADEFLQVVDGTSNYAEYWQG